MSQTFMYKLKLALKFPTSERGQRLQEIVRKTEEKTGLRTRLLDIKRKATQQYGEGVVGRARS